MKIDRMPNWAAWTLAIVCLVVIVLAVSGCCPISLRPEAVHVSHLTQHFGPNRTDVGYNAVLLDLHLEPIRHLQVDIAEGAVLGSKQTNQFGISYVGGLMGPREVFSATIGWDIPVRR